jgi:hypothetical protein
VSSRRTGAGTRRTLRLLSRSGEPFLPLLLALLYGGADLGAAVSNGARAASAAG